MSRGLAVAVTIVAGALIATQAPVNSRLGRATGTFQAATFSFAIGFFVLLVVAAVAGPGLGGLRAVTRVPWWALIGGLLGAVYVAVALVSVRSLGAAGVTAATIAGQLTMALVIDRFGLLGLARHPVTASRLAGVALLAAGLFLVVRR